MARAAGGGLFALLATKVTGSGALTQESTPCPATTDAEAKAIAEAYFAAFNAENADALGALLARTIVITVRSSASRTGRFTRSVSAQTARRSRTASTSLPTSSQDDLVAIRHVFTGTLQGPCAGVEPAGQQVAVRAVHIHRVACDQIVETWNSGDALGLLRQIGALPAPRPSPHTPLEVAVSPTVASPTANTRPAGRAEENAAIGRRWTEEALDGRNLDLLDEFFAPDLVHHAGQFVDEIGRDALKEDLAALLAAFSDIRFSADVVVATEDRAAVRWTGRGTHGGEFQGLAPTRLPVVFTGINVYRIECDRIVEGWSEPDALGLLRQLGVVPEITWAAATPTG